MSVLKADNLADVIRQRRSVRGFLPQAVAPELLRKVFEIAQRAPSNCNVQPWHVHVVSGASCEALRSELHAAAAADTPINPDFPPGGRYPGIYRDREWDAALQLYGAQGVERGDRAGRRASFLRNYTFFGAPHALFLFLDEPFGAREAADCGMYAQTLMLAMTAHGLASCAQGSLSMYPDIVRRHLGVPETQRLLFGMSFGYEDTAEPANATRVGRIALDESVRFHD